MKYTILSPDGISINIDGGFKTKKEAQSFFKDWAKRFEKQGYYSSVKFGEIALSELEEYCTLIINK